MLSKDTTEQKRGMATRRLHKQLNPSGRWHPHVCPQSDEKTQGMKNKGHLGVIADSQLYNSLQHSCKDQYNFMLHAHMHLEIVQTGHFNSPILYSSHMILHGILQSVEHQITRTIWWKLGKFLSWAMLCNRLLFNFLYKHIYNTSKSSQRKDCKQQSGSICYVNTKNGGNKL